MLIDEAAVAFGPVRLDICAGRCGNVSDFGVCRIIADFCDAEDAIAGSILEIGVEGDARAVVRPRGTPGFEFAFGDLDSVSAGRGHDVEMVPAVFIAQEGDPLAIGRGPRLRARFAPVGDAPEFFFVDLVDGFCVAGGSVGEIDEIVLEVLRLAVEDKMCVVDPGQSTVLAGLSDGDGLCFREFDAHRFGRGHIRKRGRRVWHRNKKGDSS